MQNVDSESERLIWILSQGLNNKFDANISRESEYTSWILRPNLGN
jgi:hypothetical protein